MLFWLQIGSAAIGIVAAALWFWSAAATLLSATGSK
jgi:hypothetical protein